MLVPSKHVKNKTFILHEKTQSNCYNVYLVLADLASKEDSIDRDEHGEHGQPGQCGGAHDVPQEHHADDDSKR